jgi:hypothetical protein
MFNGLTKGKKEGKEDLSFLEYVSCAVWYILRGSKIGPRFFDLPDSHND